MNRFILILLAVVFSAPVGAQDMDAKEDQREKAEIKKILGVDVDKLTPDEIGAVMRGWRTARRRNKPWPDSIAPKPSNAA